MKYGDDQSNMDSTLPETFNKAIQSSKSGWLNQAASFCRGYEETSLVTLRMGIRAETYECNARLMGLRIEEKITKQILFPLTFVNLLWDGMELHYLHFMFFKKTYLRFNIITTIIKEMLKIHSKPRNLHVNLTYLPKLQYYNKYYNEKVKNSQ